jgi:pilus assembly protein CpaC
MNAFFRTALLAAACAAGGAVSAQVPDSRVILVEQGTHKILREGAGVARVAVGDPAIADVNIVNRRELLITGKQLGVTSLHVWPATGTGIAVEYRVRVSGVRDPLRASRPDPELAQATVDPGRSLEGRLPNLLAHRRAKLAAQDGAKNGGKDVQDKSAVDLETQVMTEIKIAEVSRSTLQQFGFNFFLNKANSTAAFTNTGTLGSVNLGSIDLTTGRPTSFSFNQNGVVPLQNAFALVGGDAGRGLLGALSILSRKGLARVLAEPSLIATSGQTATYLAGGEFPVPVTQGTGGITIEYKQFGVRLSLSPTVLARNRISLKVAPEVSDLDFTAGIQMGGVAVPALTVRRTDTTVELGDGETFVISGLISSNLRNNVDKVPGLGDLPVIGAFFRSTGVQKTEKELIMVVTPSLVRPLAREAPLPRLPGERYDHYDPNFAETMLLETGKFSTGFSK